jgi:MFS family permease
MALLYGLDITIAAAVQGVVAERFQDVQKIGWVGIGFPLGSVCAILTVGAACGRFDLKYMLQLSVVVFEIGSAICGGASSMDLLIIGRVIAGVGGAGMYLASINMLSVFTTIQERPIYIGLAGLSWGIGTILGPVVGGLFSDNSPTWRWAFFINLVIAAIFAPAYIFVLPSYNPRPDTKSLKKLSSMDWVGTTLFIGLCVTLIMALTLGGVIWTWSDHRMIVLWVICGLCLIGFIIQQRFLIFTTFEDRIFPAHLLLSRSILCFYFGTAGAISAVAVVVYFM